MDKDTIAFLREMCRKVEEMAEIADRYLALEASKKTSAESTAQADHQAPKNRLIPLSSWNNYHDWPTVNGLRSYAFDRHRNGFDKVVSTVGKRLVINEEKFFEWVRSNPRSTPYS